MRNITFSMSDMHEHGSAFYDFLRLRKRQFVDTLQWDIPHNDDVEMDQYDNPLAHYSLVMDGGEILGGSRVMPCDAAWGANGCMLFDAVAGKLDGIPHDLIDESFDPATAWECTRLVISDRLDNMTDRMRCLALIVDGLVKVTADHGAAEMVSLSPPTLARALRRLGHPAEPLGKPYTGSSDGRRYVVLRMPAVRSQAMRDEDAARFDAAS